MKNTSWLVFPYCHHSWRFKVSVKYRKSFKKIVKVSGTASRTSDSKAAVPSFVLDNNPNEQCPSGNAVFCNVSSSHVVRL